MSRQICVSAVGPAPFKREAKETYEQTVENAIAHLDRWIDKVLPDHPDIIVLNEACDRPQNLGRAEGREYYAVRGLRVREHLCGLAKREGVNLAYSAYLGHEDGSFRNATTLIGRDGNICGEYHKNNLVWEENSESNVKFGKDAPLIPMDFGRVAGVICFDLNFDELREKYRQAKPDLLVFSSMYHGGFVQRSWAYSCRSYFVGAVAGLPCTVINPVGDVVAQSTNYFPYVTHRINLDYEVVHLDYNWEKLDAVKKKYGTQVNIYDPGFLGAVLLTSEAEDTSAADMVREFEIERLDDYMLRSIENRHTAGKMEE
ncbi:MAG: carbon-nitrogen hydrolase family protein [Eubacteriales bacterium]|nr:carbon-nitrogen hydrolase family protein [Eubacteriales bacterium]